MTDDGNRMETLEVASELEQLFALSLEILCLATFDGDLERVNPALERALGHCAEELLSRPLFELVHPDDREPTRDADDDLSRGTAPVHFENRCRCKDGTYRWLSWTAVPHGDVPRLLA